MNLPKVSKRNDLSKSRIMALSTLPEALVTKINRRDLYLVESKFGYTHSALAKYKLVYPYFAIKNNIPNDIQIAPIYLKTNRVGNDIFLKLVNVNSAMPIKLYRN